MADKPYTDPEDKKPEDRTPREAMIVERRELGRAGDKIAEQMEGLPADKQATAGAMLTRINRRRETLSERIGAMTPAKPEQQSSQSAPAPTKQSFFDKPHEEIMALDEEQVANLRPDEFEHWQDVMDAHEPEDREYDPYDDVNIRREERRAADALGAMDRQERDDATALEAENSLDAEDIEQAIRAIAVQEGGEALAIEMHDSGDLETAQEWLKDEATETRIVSRETGDVSYRWNEEKGGIVETPASQKVLEVRAQNPAQLKEAIESLKGSFIAEEQGQSAQEALDNARNAGKSNDNGSRQR